MGTSKVENDPCEQKVFETKDEKNGNLNNILRSLTMLEKAVNRLLRINYFNRSQYPEIFSIIEETFNKIRIWISKYESFDCLDSFYLMLGLFIKDLGAMVAELWVTCKPKPGKRKVQKVVINRQQNQIYNSINSMFENINKKISESKVNNGAVGIELEKALEKEIDKSIFQELGKKIKNLISQRGEKTYVFPFTDKDEYPLFVQDKRRFHDEVLNKLDVHTHATGHRPHCKGPQYTLCGFRKNDRKVVVIGGKQEIFRIRMVVCECGQKFSLLPSFLPREKNFAIDIIGNVFRNMFLFHQSFQGTLENIKLIGNRSVKSKQTIFNWVRWIGTHHPATILTRAGVEGSGYFQEDEGFEKEPNLRTYVAVIVDPENHLVWHSDYVDHVDEKTLCGSFGKFLERISFKVLGVSKDKWQASTNALKTLCHRLWIGYCHRHCLNNFWKALTAYQKEMQCDQKEVSRLYKEFKRVLKTSTSKNNLAVQTRTLELENPAFHHPLLQKRLVELKENAAHYTAHKKRKGITQTTSIVDNYLKIVKRKLKQVESFRDKNWARLFFQAQANTRNFVPYCPGAKYALNSPFMLAGGQTYDLPWIQVMNMHNAFLFTKNAF